MDAKTLGQRIIGYMRSLNYLVTAYNVVYIEGVDPVEDDLRLNADILDFWNDTRNVIRDDGEVLMSAIATTEPGRYYTNNPMNPGGAARIAFGQHVDAWAIGKHHDQDALVQVEPVSFYRDLNKDGFRTGDRLYNDVIGMNQHTTSNAPLMIGRWSAGCLVGRYPSSHAKFMRLMRDSKAKRFTATVLDGELLHRLKVLS